MFRETILSMYMHTQAPTHMNILTSAVCIIYTIYSQFPTDNTQGLKAVETVIVKYPHTNQWYINKNKTNNRNGMNVQSVVWAVKLTASVGSRLLFVQAVIISK